MRGEPSHEALVQGETAGEEMERLGMSWTGSGPEMLGWRRGGIGLPAWLDCVSKPGLLPRAVLMEAVWGLAPSATPTAKSAA